MGGIVDIITGDTEGDETFSVSNERAIENERLRQGGEKELTDREKAIKENQESRERALDLAGETRERASERVTEFESVYGNLESNLAEYYSNLTPERATSLGLQNQQRASSAALTKIRATLAQRGLSGSGAEAALVSQVALQGAQQRALVRDTAEENVNQQKLGFLKFGAGQQQFRLGLEANARVAEQNIAAGFAAPSSNIFVTQQQIQAQTDATNESRRAAERRDDTDRRGQNLGFIGNLL